jgi:hypothetical protein
MNSIHDDYNTQPQSDEYATEHEEVRGTFAAEPAFLRTFRCVSP